MTESKTDLPLTGQCFCGASTIVATQRPETVVYCHCIDCRRATGAPITAFAAFDAGAVTFTPNEGKSVSVVKGAARSFCEGCGSSLSGRYEPILSHRKSMRIRLPLSRGSTSKMTYLGLTNRPVHS